MFVALILYERVAANKSSATNGFLCVEIRRDIIFGINFIFFLLFFVFFSGLCLI